jgi:transcriptional regulator with XRE-family HTH domain
MTQTVPWFRGRTTAAIGEAVHELRVGNHESQEQFAQSIGSSRATVSRLERGESVTDDVLLAALARLGHEIAIVPRGSRLSIRLSDEPR